MLSISDSIIHPFSRAKRILGHNPSVLSDPEIWLRHLREDILPYWLHPTALGEPVGNFPTERMQDGTTVSGAVRRTRMQGRQIFAYLVSYELLGDPRLLDLARVGLAWMDERLRNPSGGWYPVSDEAGKPDRSATVTVQDLCYAAFPRLELFRLTGDAAALADADAVLELLLRGPFLLPNGILADALDARYVERRPFEGSTTNVVSYLDLLNLMLVRRIEVDSNPSPALVEDLRETVGRFVGLYWKDSIFWNDLENRTDCGAKHVDFGHTAKGYAILRRTNRILRERGLSPIHPDVEARFPELARAATDPIVGWRTDFLDSATTFRPGSLQWWRHIQADQTTLLYAEDDREMASLAENGAACWLELPFADRGRDIRGIREGLRPDGTLYGDDVIWTCKANLWKNAYHEVDHVRDLVRFAERHGRP